MLIDAHTQVTATLTVSGATLLVMTICLVGGGYVRECTGQHAGTGPGAITVTALRTHITAEPHRESATPPEPDAPESREYVGRHRLHESHPDHGAPLEPPRPQQPNPCRPVNNHIPCGLISGNSLKNPRRCEYVRAGPSDTRPGTGDR
ncbi:hypothetical protein FHX42_000147 [Saccharopolyspora lacisalsi]|uniref:Uncharacterized protein n=1 Tax=Halosaccharopolyspora lacisalsi TaxID=1000566 RepID=A0A839DVI4_9PSEU|nr:hypothetical protein [Halosaccharopolyspora lacisalsi]MBA8822818.1 hypothetical protein [Halosaccharopolyspora lacisalsi]